MKIRSLVVVILLALMPVVSHATEILYGISDGAGVPENNLIYQINPANADLSNMVQLTLSGSTIEHTKGLAAWSGVLWGLVTLDVAPDTTHLVTINPVTGVCTEIGAQGGAHYMESMAFRSNGILYGVTGDRGLDQECLFTIDTGTGEATFLFSLSYGGGGGSGVAMAFYPGGQLYRSFGDCPAFFESIDVDTKKETFIDSTSCTSGLGMGYSGLLGMFLSNQYSHLYTVNLKTGYRTAIGLMCDQLPGCHEPPWTGYVTENKGLAFISVP